MWFAGFLFRSTPNQIRVYVPARYGRKAKNYALVITAARLYWNGCLPLVNEPMERQLLK